MNPPATAAALPEAIDQHGEPDLARPAKIRQRIQGRPHGPPRKQYIIHKKHGYRVDGEIYARRTDHRLGPDLGQVVAIQRDIENAAPDLCKPPAAQRVGQPLGERLAAGADSNDIQGLIGLERRTNGRGEFIEHPRDFAFVIPIPHRGERVME